MLRTSWLVALSVLATTACGHFMPKKAVESTSMVLSRAAASMEQESDWDIAAHAIPATLKTIEGFHVAYPEVKSEVYTMLLAQAYCQYATGFIEDEFEQADAAHDTEAMEYQAARATKSYFRCMNYALANLGGGWKAAVLSDLDAVAAKAAAAGQGSRTAMMWVAIGLAGAINYNRDDINLVAHLPKARVLLERVVALDDANPGDTDVSPALRAMPHIALGMLHSSMSPALGGKPELSAEHFKRAIAVTDGKFLLVKVNFARRYAVARQDRASFRKTLIEVLQTDPAIWPEQRLANEIAHRRARRYLKREKEWF